MELDSVMPKFEVSIQETSVAFCHFNSSLEQMGPAASWNSYCAISEGDNKISACRAMSEK